MRSPSGLLAAAAAIIALSQVCFAEQRETSDNHNNNRNENGKIHNVHFDNPVRSHHSYETANPQDRIYAGNRVGKEGYFGGEDGRGQRDERGFASWHPALQFPPHTQEYPSPQGPQYSHYSLPSQHYPPLVRPVPNDERNYDPRGYPFSPDYHQRYPTARQDNRGTHLRRHQGRSHDFPGPKYLSTFPAPQMYSPHRMDNQFEASPGPGQGNRLSGSDPQPSQPMEQGSHASVSPEPTAKSSAPIQSNSQKIDTNDEKNPIHIRLDQSHNLHENHPQKHPKVQTVQASRDEHDQSVISSSDQKSKADRAENSALHVSLHPSEKNNTDETSSKSGHDRESRAKDSHAKETHAKESRANKDPQPEIDDPQFQYQNNLYRTENWGQPPIFAPQFFEKSFSEYNKP